MKLGLGSYACAWEIGVPGSPPPAPLSAAGLVDRASSLGLSLVQIADNLPLHELPDAELISLYRRAQALGVEIEVGTRGISIGHLHKYISICRLLHSRLLRVVVDTASHHPSPVEVVTLVHSMLPDLISSNIALAIENHDRFSSAALASIVRDIGSEQVGICLDTVNSFGSLEGPEVVVDTLAPYVLNLHVKDFRIQRAVHMMGFTIDGTPAGEGRLDVPLLLARLKNAGRDPNAIIELWPAPESDMEATVAKERQWVELSVRNLRKLLPA